MRLALLSVALLAFLLLGASACGAGMRRSKHPQSSGADASVVLVPAEAGAPPAYTPQPGDIQL